MPRGRPKKKKEELSEAEVWDVLEFAKHLNGIYPGLFTPDLVNSRLKDLTLSPISGTETDINTALANPKDNEENLIGYSHYFELVDMIYKRSILYFANLPSWDLTYTCTNADRSDYRTNKYKNDEKRLMEFFDNFDFKQEFRTVLKQLFRQETFFCIFREDGEKYTLQELSRKHSKITGRWEYGLLFDYDMQFFLQPGIDINLYPDKFKQLYRKIFNGKNKPYNPSATINKRNSSFAYWVQLSPQDGFWAWKLNPEIATAIPFFSPMFPDLALRPTIRKLQKNQFIIQASKILIGLIGFNKDNKSGSIKDSFNISPEVAGKFANLIRQALSSEIQFGLGPYSDVKSFEWKGDGTNMLDQYNKTTIASSGNNSRVLYNTDRMNAIESKSSLSIDEQVVTALYPYFEQFLNYFINRKTKKYKFKFKLEGVNMSENKKERFDTSMKLAEKGLFLPQKVSAAIGVLPFELERMLDEANEKDWNEKLIPILNIYNSKDGGRPQKPDSELGDSGEQTRTDGGNIDKGTGNI